MCPGDFCDSGPESTCYTGQGCRNGNVKDSLVAAICVQKWNVLSFPFLTFLPFPSSFFPPSSPSFLSPLSLSPLPLPPLFFPIFHSLFIPSFSLSHFTYIISWSGPHFLIPARDLGSAVSSLSCSGEEPDRQTLQGEFWAESHAFGDTKSTVNKIMSQLAFWIANKRTFLWNYW